MLRIEKNRGEIVSAKFAAITGHTRGVGKMASEALSRLGYEILGFSRAGGYDVLRQQDRERILKECAHCDVFINNAHAGYAQAQLLMELMELWRAHSKLIINIGVDSFPPSTWRLVHTGYIAEKAALHAAVEAVHQDIRPRLCRVMNLALGHMNTESNSKYAGAKVSAEDFYRTLKAVVEWPESIEVKSLTLAPRVFGSPDAG